jgi:hypothetical protein
MRFSFTVFRPELRADHLCLTCMVNVFHLVIYLVTLCNVIFFGHELVPFPRYHMLENLIVSAVLDRLYSTIFVPTFYILWLSVHRNHVPLVYVYVMICTPN